jgi:hypothetical protein
MSGDDINLNEGVMKHLNLGLDKNPDNKYNLTQIPEVCSNDNS